MNFTSKERQAIACAVTMMITADGKLQNSERLFGAVLLAKIHISEEELQNAANLQGDEVAKIISDMSFEQKEMVAAILGCVMISDGNIDESEHALWCIMTKICNLPTMNIDTAKRIIGNL
ncbi:MAG: hypothetical protein ACI35T_01785 [Alistipes sp.]